MKIGVLGTGFGMIHLQTFQNHPLVNELVFFSRTQDKVDEVSVKLGLWGTTNLDDILCDPGVDVVTIALPHALHARTAIRAMEQGKDVICEVPVCPTLEEAKQLADVSERTGRRVFVDLFSRFAPAHRFLREHHLQRIRASAVPTGSQPLCPCLGAGPPGTGRAAAGELFLRF